MFTISSTEYNDKSSFSIITVYVRSAHLIWLELYQKKKMLFTYIRLSLITTHFIYYQKGFCWSLVIGIWNLHHKLYKAVLQTSPLFTSKMYNNLRCFCSQNDEHLENICKKLFPCRYCRELWFFFSF